jgi:molybdate transport system substrate-binding protein
MQRTTPARIRRPRLGGSTARVARLVLCLGLCLLAIPWGACSGDRFPATEGASREALVLFVAVSAADALDAVAERFTAQGGPPVRIHAAATSTLAAQIRAGARADLFLSADQAWMDEVAGSGLLKAGTRRDLLANELVIVGGPEAAAFVVERGSLPPALASARRIAIADPELVPAGRAARASLLWLGWWEDVSAKRIAAPDVRAALRLVEMGEADIGFVYATDAFISTSVRTLARLPAESHPPIVYPAALLRDARPGADALIEYLSNAESRRILEAAGFRVLAPP